MHDHFRTLLDLHEVNAQRQRLIKQRQGREQRLTEAQQRYNAAQAAADEARNKVANMDALIRQYQADVERCVATMASLREQQMSAKTNKEYLSIINGIEEVKSERGLREQSLESLQGKVTSLQEEAKALQQVADELQGEVSQALAANEAATDSDDGEAALQRIYDEKKVAVDAKILEHYERLISSNHPMPLMRVDPVSRATPLGTIISHNHLEQIRIGRMVTEATNNAILYLDE